MGIKQYKPTSAGRRGGMVSDFADCTNPRVNAPEKTLLKPLKKKGGRNVHGVTTSRFRGGGHKRMYRVIDFKRKRDGVEATVLSIEYDPCRSAGCAAVLTAREKDWAQLTMPSGEIRRVSSKCRATLGQVSNAEHMNISIGKAGRMRWKGRKPHNRGTSQNPVDHPMGGGEGRTAGGRDPCSPWGVLAKGGKTRKKRKPGNKSILRRRPSGPFQQSSG